MAWSDSLERLVFDDLLDGLLPDFVLAFTLFTALCYAVLGRAFGRERPAAAMSVALGLALAIGMVWWEMRAELSVRDLGPIAVGLALVVLAGVVYAATQRVGGNWAGAGTALGVCLMIGVLLPRADPQSEDAADALAIAVTHAHHRASIGTMVAAAPPRRRKA